MILHDRMEENVKKKQLFFASMPREDMTSDYSSAYGVLNDFSSELYLDTMRLSHPIVSATSLVKHTAAGVSKRSIDKVLNLPFQQQEQLLGFLIELVVEHREKDEHWEKFTETVLKKIKKNIDFNTYFSTLDRHFKTLNTFQQTQIIRLSLNKLVSELESMRREINTRIMNKHANRKELFILDQVLCYLFNTLSNLPLEKKVSASDKKKIERRMGFGLYLILRLEAYRRRRITLDDLTEDISLFPTFIPQESYIKPSEYKVALEVFGG
jgi:hypothetical protein